MSVERVIYQSRGLRTGELGTIRLVRNRGPVVFRFGDKEFARDAIEFTGGPHSSVASLGGRLIAGLEPVLAALAGMSVHSSVEVHLDGRELPVLDASGLEIALALRALAAPRDRPRLRVVQSGEVLAGRARYSFEPRPTVEVVAEVDGPAGTKQRAQWDGTPAAFLARVSARPLQIGGVESVRILTGESVPPSSNDPPSSAAGRQFDHDEARGALLRLLADLYRFGGPPLGRVFARRPDHTASQRALGQGLKFGLLERLPPA
ncbi:MAG: UDP-3-O-acyl-N-acetylglucosamine deacetylase [Polyangiaceae bacterium]|nr:UDP-3-O-acyl-N-acetylglucosamine deacetylase [Polyangiaceae bacterium]